MMQPAINFNPETFPATTSMHFEPPSQPFDQDRTAKRHSSSTSHRSSARHRPPAKCRWQRAAKFHTGAVYRVGMDSIYHKTHAQRIDQVAAAHRADRVID